MQSRRDLRKNLAAGIVFFKVDPVIFFKVDLVIFSRVDLGITNQPVSFRSAAWVPVPLS